MVQAIHFEGGRLVMRSAHFFCGLSLLHLAAAVLSTAAIAQTPVDPGQLPGSTSFYFFWHGAPTGEIRKSNALYALWDDPDFAAARSAWLESFLNEAQGDKTPEKTKLNREDFAQFVTLLDNSLLLGALREPEASAAKRHTAAGKDLPRWDGTFFIYDRTGKEELLSKAVLRMRSEGTDIPKLTNLNVAGVPTLKIERKNGVTYWAEIGKNAVAASEVSVFEDILGVVNGKSSAAALVSTSAYQEAKPQLTGGVVDFFVAVPSLKDLAIDTPAASGPSIRPLLNAIRLDTVHSIAGHIALEGPKTHLSGAILGDTAPGGLFDIWADGQVNPASLPFVSPDTIYYSESQFNLLGIYQTLKHAFTQGPNNSAQFFTAMESAAETRLGMPLPDALALPSGEIAWLQASPTFDDSLKLYIFGINNKLGTLKLTRTVLGDRISSEKNEGNATFLKISLQGGQSSAGVAQWNFYYVAMTPSLLFGSSKSENIRRYLSQPAGSDSPLAKNLLAARSRYPEKLNGFSYFDFQRVDWPGLKAKWIADTKKSAEKAKSNDQAKTDNKLAEWLNGVNPEVFPRHLHTMAGASWKDAKGVHFDEWLE
jgi:hypothetical protein